MVESATADFRVRALIILAVLAIAGWILFAYSYLQASDMRRRTADALLRAEASRQSVIEELQNLQKAAGTAAAVKKRSDNSLKTLAEAVFARNSAQSELADLINRTDEAKQAIIDLRRDVTAKAAERQAVEAQLESEAEQVAAFRSESATLAMQQDKARADLAEAQRQVMAVQGEAETTEKDLDAKTAEWEAVDAQLKTESDRLVALQGGNAASATQLAKALVDVAQAQNQAKAAQEQAATAEKDTAARAGELQTVEAKLNSESERLSALQDEKAALATQRAKSEADAAQAQNQAKAAQVQAETVEKDTAAKASELQTVEAKLNSESERLSALQDEKAALATQLAKAQADFAQAQNQAKAAQVQAETVEAKLNSESERLSALQDEKAALATQTAKAEADAAQAQNQTKAAQVQAETVEKDATAKASELQTVEAKLNSESERLSALQAEKAALATQRANAEADVAQAQSRTKAAQEQAETAEKDTAAKASELQTVEAKLNSESERLSALQDEKAALATQRAKAEADAAQAQNQTKAAQEQAETAEKDTTAKASELQTVEAKLNSESERLSALKGQMASLATQRAKAEADAAQAQKQAKVALEDANAKSYELQAVEARLKRTLHQLTALQGQTAASAAQRAKTQAEAAEAGSKAKTAQQSTDAGRTAGKSATGRGRSITLLAEPGTIVVVDEFARIEAPLVLTLAQRVRETESGTTPIQPPSELGDTEVDAPPAQPADALQTVPAAGTPLEAESIAGHPAAERARDQIPTITDGAGVVLPSATSASEAAPVIEGRQTSETASQIVEAKSGEGAMKREAVEAGASRAETPSSVAAVAAIVPPSAPQPVFSLGGAMVDKDFLADLPAFTDRDGANGMTLRAEPNPPDGVIFRDLGAGFGEMKGRPTRAGQFAFDVVATDSAGGVGRMTVKIAVAPSRPVAIPPPLKPEANNQVAARELANRANDFVRSFNGGACFLARVRGGDANSVMIEGVGGEKVEFQKFYESFIRDVGIEPNLAVRLITPLQCSVVRLMAAVDANSPTAPTIQLATHEISGGAPLAGKIGALAGRHVDLLLVTEDGRATKLAGWDPSSDQDETFSLPISSGVDSTSALQVLLAVASPKPLDALAAFQSGRAADIFPEVAAQIASSVASIAVEYIKFRK